MSRKDELRDCKTCTIAGEEFEQPHSPVKAIRAFCMDCMGGSKTAEQGSIASCPSKGRCALWPFRFGKNPFIDKNSNLTDEQKQASLARLKLARDKRKSIVDEDDSDDSEA